MLIFTLSLVQPFPIFNECIIIFFISTDNIELKYIYLELGFIFSDNFALFFLMQFCAFVCVSLYVCVYIFILPAELVCFISLLNQLCECSKSHKHMAHIIYWKGRNYYTVIIQRLHMGMFNFSRYVGYFQQFVKLSYCVLLITNVSLSKHLVNLSKQ